MKKERFVPEKSKAALNVPYTFFVLWKTKLYVSVNILSRRAGFILLKSRDIVPLNALIILTARSEDESPLLLLWNGILNTELSQAFRVS